jgi:hypothetical protein
MADEGENARSASTAAKPGKRNRSTKLIHFLMGETRAAWVGEGKRPSRAEVERSVIAVRARRGTAEKLICNGPREGLRLEAVFMLPGYFRYCTSLDASFENVLSFPFASTSVTAK